MSTCANLIQNTYASSRWQAAWLPIRYQVSSDKWPVNTADATYTITSVSDIFGYCEVTITSAYAPFLLGQFVRITGASVAEYNGIWRVTEVIDNDTFVINCPFSATATGTVQTYYNNYQIQARVYVGIPSGHFYNSERPMSLKTETLPGIPNDENIATIDISDFVRQDLGIAENAICEVLEPGQWIANDWKGWTAFETDFRESYDVPNSEGLLETFFSDWESLTTTTYYASRSALPFQSLQGVNMGGYAMLPNLFDITGSFMTLFQEPTYFLDNEFDLSIISTETNIDRYGVTHVVNIEQYDESGSQIQVNQYNMPFYDEGVYRFVFSELEIWNTNASYFEIFVQRVGAQTKRVSERKRVLMKPENCRDAFFVRWLNQVGGWDAWRFDGYVKRGIDTGDAVTIRRDIWRNYDGDFANAATIDDYISRSGKETVLAHTAFLSDQEAIALRWLRVSVKVQEVYFTTQSGCDGYKRRTWLVENQAFQYLDKADKRRELALKFTDTSPLFIQGQ